MNILQTSSKLAIAYYRHSAEDKQEFSIPVQREEIHKFAKKHNITIVKEFEDAGVSGLLSKRPGFEKLLECSKKENFHYVLVFDVTRWGRFQDMDESAYYEFLIKRAGKRVIYIDKGFTNDENPLVNDLIKTIDRYMAADYSKKLSEKVFLGSKKIASLGFSVGGKAPYGLRRLLLDANKNPVRILKDGEHKSIDNERVIFTLGPKEEVKIIKRIFDDFVNKNMDKSVIAQILNSEGIHSPKGRSWDSKKISDILRNEIYIGTKIYNKTTQKLKTRTRANPKDSWVICKDAFEAIVNKDLFYKAQEKMSQLRLYYPTEKLIDELKQIFEKHKKVTSDLINGWDNTGCASTYRRRFVSLYNAYVKINYLPKRAFIYFKKREHNRHNVALIIKDKLKDQKTYYKEPFMYVNDKKILITPAVPSKRKKHHYWTFYFETKDVDFALCVGFSDKENKEIAKYFLFPKSIIEDNVVNVNAKNDKRFENYERKEINDLIRFT